MKSTFVSAVFVFLCLSTFLVFSQESYETSFTLPDGTVLTAEVTYDGTGLTYTYTYQGSSITVDPINDPDWANKVIDWWMQFFQFSAAGVTSSVAYQAQAYSQVQTFSRQVSAAFLNVRRAHGGVVTETVPEEGEEDGQSEDETDQPEPPPRPDSFTALDTRFDSYNEEYGDASGTGITSLSHTWMLKGAPLTRSGRRQDVMATLSAGAGGFREANPTGLRTIAGGMVFSRVLYTGPVPVRQGSFGYFFSMGTDHVSGDLMTASQSIVYAQTFPARLNGLEIGSWTVPFNTTIFTASLAEDTLVVIDMNVPASVDIFHPIAPRTELYCTAVFNIVLWRAASLGLTTYEESLAFGGATADIGVRYRITPRTGLRAALLFGSYPDGLRSVGLAAGMTY
jgi:hypothetical protein